MADILITDLTNGKITSGTDGQYEWSGSGVFDKLIIAVNQNIKIQYDNGRIKDDKYADVYLGSMQSVIEQSVKFLLEEKKIEAEIGMLEAQKIMIGAQTAEIAPNATKTRQVQDAQIAQLKAEKDYTVAKEEVMEQSRIDNLALEALKAQMQNLATVGAGGLTPSTNDFAAANSLRSAIYERARGVDLPEVTFLAGASYVKAT